MNSAFIFSFPLPGLLIALLTCLFTGCFQPPAGSGAAVSASSSAPQPTLTPAPGPMAVKIIFKADGSSSIGSFYDSEIDSGTQVAIAKKLFPVDGTNNPIATGGPGSSGWPAWLTTVRVGLTGTTRTVVADQKPNCARFADATTTPCAIGPGGVAVNCNGPAGYLRVSEVDCGNTLTKGTGSEADPVYIRVTFSDQVANLAAHENIMAVLEYAAASINPPPSDPTACFTGGLFTPGNTNCSDQTWNVYLKKLGNTAAANPFLMLIPPAYSYLRPLSVSSAESVGAGVASKQIFLPLASNPGLRVLQISRTNATSSYTYSGVTCPSNSPLCLGMVLYSLTLYRM
ncbi:MAG: hypothetical protein H7222_04055 [Methylotenera sp.]|nr:hypothetical protein [Oligoflexia bacterium]